MKSILLALPFVFISFLLATTVYSEENILTLLPQTKLKTLQLQSSDINGVKIAWSETGNPEGVPALFIVSPTY